MTLWAVSPELFVIPHGLPTNKLGSKLEEIDAIDHEAKSLSSWHFAPQRFNTVVEICEKILLRLPVIFEVLQHCVAAKD